MPVHIQEVVSTVRAFDGTSLLDERTMAQIVRAVMTALEAQKTQEERRVADTSTSASAQGRVG